MTCTYLPRYKTLLNIYSVKMIKTDWVLWNLWNGASPSRLLNRSLGSTNACFFLIPRKDTCVLSDSSQPGHPHSQISSWLRLKAHEWAQFKPRGEGGMAPTFNSYCSKLSATCLLTSLCFFLWAWPFLTET